MTFARTFRSGDRVRLGDRTGFFVRINRGGQNEAIVEWDDSLQLEPCAYDALRHSPVAVIGLKPATRPDRCPECGATDLTFDPETLKGMPQPDGKTELSTVPTVACGHCEWIQEITR